jgi:hypothetical protein
MPHTAKALGQAVDAYRSAKLNFLQSHQQTPETKLLWLTQLRDFFAEELKQLERDLEAARANVKPPAPPPPLIGQSQTNELAKTNLQEEPTYAYTR